MLTHIASLEDTVIALSDTDDNTVKYRKAQKVAKKIKRKRQDRRQRNDDSDISKESIRRRSPCFRLAQGAKNARIFKYDTTKNDNTEEKNQEIEVEENNHNE